MSTTSPTTTETTAAAPAAPIGAMDAAGASAATNATVSTDATGKSFAITSFVLGIASIVASWTFIGPIVGLIFGVLALRRNTTERTLALWGVWLNVAMLALTVLAVLAMIVIFGIALAVGLPGIELSGL